MRSPLHDRRGDWIQLFMVFFFVLILILSIAMLTLDLGKIKSDREQLDVDLIDQEANTQLINILRYETVDAGKRAPLADIIILADPVEDELISKTLANAVPSSYYFELDIIYPGGEQLIVTNTEYKAATKEMLRKQGPQAMRDLSRTEKQSQVLPETLTTTLLPGAGGNIKVELFLSHKLGEDKAAQRVERITRGAT